MAQENIPERLGSLIRLLTTLDRRLEATFDTMDRVGAATDGLENLSAEGEGLVADLKRRMARMEKRVNADLDELKAALKDKLAEVDVRDLTRRLDALEESIRNIEIAVTRVDSTVEGAVEAAPNFVTRRVRDRAEEIEEELPGAAAR